MNWLVVKDKKESSITFVCVQIQSYIAQKGVIIIIV